MFALGHWARFAVVHGGGLLWGTERGLLSLKVIAGVQE